MFVTATSDFVHNVIEDFNGVEKIGWCIILPENHTKY
jgi:hypothetical protein